MTKSDIQPISAENRSALSRGAATRLRIIEATVELVAELGWDVVTTRQIAERAEANQGLIHYHFGSRAELLHAAFEAVLRDVFAGPTEAMLRAPTLAEGAAALVMELAQFDAAGPVARFSMEALSRAGRDERLRAATSNLLAEFRGLIADRVREEQARGLISSRLDPVGTATALGAMLDGLGLHLTIDPALDMKRTAEAITALLSPPKRTATTTRRERKTQ